MTSDVLLLAERLPVPGEVRFGAFGPETPGDELIPAPADKRHE